MSDPYADDFFSPTAPPQMKGPRPHLRFWTEPILHEGKSAEEGRPVYIEVDMVGITNPGSRDEVVRKAVDKAKDGEFYAWAYKKWKSTQEQPVSGTPVETVPFLNKAQVLELKAINIHTLETLAEAPETAIQRMMGLRELQKKAKAYMEAAKDTAIVTKLQGELDQRDRELDRLKEQMSQMSARFDEMAKKVTA